MTTNPVARGDTTPQLREALEARRDEIRGLAEGWRQDGDSFVLTTDEYDRYVRTVREAQELRDLLDLSRRADEVIETVEIMTMESATPIRTIEVYRESAPPERVTREEWEHRKAEEARLERLRQIRKACETAADSFDRHAFRRRAPAVKRWHRWWFSPRVIREREAAWAAGLDAEQARHVLAAELRNTAELPDDILEWLLGEGWRPPKPEEWVWLD